MRRNILLAVLCVFVLAACGGAGTSSSNQNEIGTLEPVPAEYAGKTNPLGTDAAAEGAMVPRATEMDRQADRLTLSLRTWQSFRKAQLTTIYSGGSAMANPGHPWLPGRES